MPEMKEVPIRLGAGYAYGAQHSGFTLMDSIREIIDNSNAAGASEIRIAMQLQSDKKLFTLMFKDNGHGMSPEGLEEALTILGNKKAQAGNHYGMGMKQSFLTMCKDGYVTVKTVKNKILSVARLSTLENGKSPSVKFETPQYSETPDGTFIEVTNIDIFHGAEYDSETLKNQLHEILMDLSVRYYPMSKKNPKYKIYVPNPETVGETVIPVTFQDPLYREKYQKKKNDSKPWIKHVIEKAEVEGKEVILEAYAYIKENFDEDFDKFGPIDWDKPAPGKRNYKNFFSKTKSGVYLENADRFCTLGDFWFINNGQFDTNNLRIYVKIPEGLTSCFLQQNKSKPEVNDARLRNVKTAIEIIIQWHREENCFKRKANGQWDYKNTDNDSFDNGINAKLRKGVTVNPLANDQVANLVPVTQHKVRPKSTDLIRVVRANMGKNGDHYEASRMEDKLILTLNNDHAWVHNFFDKIANEDEKQNWIVQLYSRHTALLKASAIENMKRNAIHRIIQEESNALRNFYEVE